MNKVLCKHTFTPFKKGEYYSFEKESFESCIIYYLRRDFGYRFYYLDSGNIGGHNIFDEHFMTEKQIRRDKLKKIIYEQHRY